MKKSLNLTFSVLGLVTIGFCAATFAASKDEQAVKEVLDQRLANARPGMFAVSVEKTDVDDLFEVSLNNGDQVYATKDGRYLFAGSLFRLDDKRLVDVREEKLVPMRAKALAAIPLEESIRFVPGAGKPKSVIHVFTDVDCGFCQKMHAHMAEYNAQGIEVRYLAFPRAGANSISAKKLSNAWCADDQKGAIDKLLTRQSLPDKSCDNPVANQYALGQQLGVTGTPAVFKSDGTLIGGYLTPAQLVEQLGLQN